MPILGQGRQIDHNLTDEAGTRRMSDTGYPADFVSSAEIMCLVMSIDAFGDGNRTRTDAAQ